MSEAVPHAYPPHHRLTLRAQFGALHLDVDASFGAPWTVLFGPSGSGKSTLLQILAGTLRGSGSSLTTASAHVSRHEPHAPSLTLTKGTWSLPPEKREIAYAPQTASLFPHLTVRENVLFATSVASHKAATLAEGSALLNSLGDRARDIFELAPLWERRPAELSGGEQQRVNLARAFAHPRARLLLLDEPFTGLDRGLRDRLLLKLRPALLARGLPVISVTHDIEEAFLLEAEIMRLDAGRIVAQGPAAEVLATERTSLLSTLRPASLRADSL